MNNKLSPVIDVTYNVLPPKSDKNNFTEPCIPARKRLRSREPDDVSPSKYFITLVTS